MSTHAHTHMAHKPSGEAGRPLPSPAKDCRGVDFSFAFSAVMAASNSALKLEEIGEQEKKEESAK